jgi:hypothetical protein
VGKCLLLPREGDLRYNDIQEQQQHHSISQCSKLCPQSTHGQGSSPHHRKGACAAAMHR